MNHRQVLDKFKQVLPSECVRMVYWFPNGKNSIRVRTKSEHEPDYIFTFNSIGDWCYETEGRFIKNMTKKGSK